MTELNTCNGEVVVLDGRFQFFQDRAGTTHTTVHAKGVGDQGNTYVLNIDDRAAADGIVQRRVLVSLGSAPNQIVLITLPSSGGFFIETECTG